MISTRISLVAPFLALALPALGAAPSREIAPRTVALPVDGTLSIDTYKGTVAVTTWEKSEVLVKARIEADGVCGDRQGQAATVEKTHVIIESRASRASVKSDYSDVQTHWSWFGSCNARPFVHYEISMPRTASLRLKDYKSDSHIGNLAGDVAIETYKGSVLVELLDGGLRAETYKGDIKVVMASVRRDVNAETYKGTIDLVMPPKAAFTLDAKADRGEVDLRGFGVVLASKGRGRRDQSARGDVNGGGPRVHLSTHKGTIRVSAR